MVGIILAIAITCIGFILSEFNKDGFLMVIVGIILTIISFVLYVK